MMQIERLWTNWCFLVIKRKGDGKFQYLFDQKIFQTRYTESGESNSMNPNFIVKFVVSLMLSYIYMRDVNSLSLCDVLLTIS